MALGTPQAASSSTGATFTALDAASLRPRPLAVAAILVTVQLIFGGYAIVVKIALQDEAVDALVFSLYRDVGASVVLLACCALLGELRPVAAADRLTFLGVGLLGITLTQKW